MQGYDRAMVLGALLGVVVGVLAVGGIAKLRAPEATTPMLRALGLPARPWVARLLGVVELGIGTATFLLGGPVLAALTALVFAGFTVSILRLRSSTDGAVSCGCFGRASAPPSAVHVVVDGVAALVAAAAAMTEAPGFVDMRPDLPAAGVVYLLVVTVAIGLTVALLTALPEALTAARRLPASEANRTRPVELFRMEAPLP